MSYNRRSTQKRGGRIKNNFIDNIPIRRSNTSNNMSYAAQLRSNISNSENNIQSTSDFYDDHKTLYILCKYYLGNFVTIKTESEEFNGVLKAVSPNGDFCLTEATVFNNNNEYMSRNEKFKMIPIKDIKIVEAKNVDSNYHVTSTDNDKIPTDEEIAKRRMLNYTTDENQYDLNGTTDIELTPFYDSSVSFEDNCLNACKVGAHWFPPEEMFEKNKISFNVKSTYKENLEGYTTQLNKEDPNFERDLRIAQRKALEIERDRDTCHDDLENGEEKNEELLFCSIPRVSESHNITENNGANSHTKSLSQQIRKCVDNNSISSFQDSVDQRHNLNPNAREFTPISSSAPYCDIPNISMQMNSLNIQNAHNYSNIIHPQGFIPYSIPVMLPHHLPNSVPIIQNPGMDQFLIPRQNFIPNYPMSPFFLSNQCQIAFDPNLMTQIPNIRFDNNFQNPSFSMQNDVNSDRETTSNDFQTRSETANDLDSINEDKKRDGTDNLKKLNSVTDEYAKVLRDPATSLQDSTSSSHNYDLNDSIGNYQKLNSHLANNQRMYNQVVTSNSQAYILPANITHGIRNVGSYPQMVPNQISYIPNYFPRQPSLVTPLHQVIPNLMNNSSPMHQNVPVQMKSITTSNPNFQPGFQSNPSFVPIMNPQINGQNFHTIIPGYPPQMSTPINAHLQIPFQPNIPQYPQFLTPVQSCNYFTPVPLPPQQPN